MIDPDGMFDQYYGTNGDYLGQDEKGNNGRVGVVDDKSSLATLKANKKSKTDVNSKDIKSRVNISKDELSKAKDVLDRTNANGGKFEETTLMKDGVATMGPRGSAEHVMMNGVEVATATIDITGKSGGTSIHSHLTNVDDDGTNVNFSLATKMGPNDPGIFSNFSQNIIVGNIEAPTISGGDMLHKRQVSIPAQGAVLYNTSSGKPLTLPQATLIKIIKP